MIRQLLLCDNPAARGSPRLQSTISRSPSAHAHTVVSVRTEAQHVDRLWPKRNTLTHPNSRPASLTLQLDRWRPGG